MSRELYACPQAADDGASQPHGRATDARHPAQNLGRAVPRRPRQARQARQARPGGCLRLSGPGRGRGAEEGRRQGHQRVAGQALRRRQAGAAGDPAGHRYVGQGRHHPQRVQRDRAARRHRHGVPPAERSGAGARLPVARAPRLPAPRRNRHLQPLALRGRAGGARAPAGAGRGDRAALRADQRLRALADGERHRHPQVHAAHLEEGAGRAPAGSPRQAREPLEVRSWRP